MLKAKQESLSVSQTPTAVMKGKQVYLVHLQNDDISMTISNYGCIVLSVITPDREGQRRNIVAGFEDIRAYEKNEHYLGCVVGRYANRIAGGMFQYGTDTFRLSVNNTPNHLHGGFEGFDKQVWNIVELIEKGDQAGVMFQYLSKDGEEGYPGNLQVTVKYILDDQNRFSIIYEATTDKITPVNLTHHAYFNLTGFDNPLVTDHLLQVNAQSYTEKNVQNTPTGQILSVADTPLDFRNPKRIGEAIDKLGADNGYDHNYVLPAHQPGEKVLAAILYDPATGRKMQVSTDQPGMQVYTANFWDGNITGSQQVPYYQHGAVALETQAFPDSPNQPNFPDTLLKPGTHYRSATTYEFTTQ